MSELSEGKLVEVRMTDEGFEGSWYEAKIVKQVGKDKFHVRYETLRTDDDEDFLEEDVDAQNIRPSPPEIIIVDNFAMTEEVDAFYNDGWWKGMVVKVLKGGRYRVYFETTEDEIVFEHSQLRSHQDWINNTWIKKSQVYGLNFLGL
ncbi:hypothetical protein UlMin_024662 [Ulmus minor]